jgi:hypothetical protein
VKAEKQLVHPLHRATSKPRQEGFKDKHEEEMILKISAPEYTSGDTTVHADSKTWAANNEKLSGVRKLYLT